MRVSESKEVPRVLVTAMMHSREFASLTVVLYWMRRMLGDYELDARCKYLLSTREFWVIPVLNIDGFIANKNSRSKMIRKNARPTCPRRQEQGGVDLNRNFDYAWKPNSHAVCQEEYPGTAPFSEPESQAVRDVVTGRKFTMAINYHTFGSMLTHPFNHAKQGASLLPPDDRAIYNELEKELKFDLFGPAQSTVGYTTTGEADDWLYGKMGIISMTPEVGPENDGFHPPQRHIAQIDELNYGRLLSMAEKSGFEPTVHWVRRGQQSFQPLEIGNTGLAPAKVRIVLPQFAGRLTSDAGEAVGASTGGGWVAEVTITRRSKIALRVEGVETLPGICLVDLSAGPIKVCRCALGHVRKLSPTSMRSFDALRKRIKGRKGAEGGSRTGKAFPSGRDNAEMMKKSKGSWTGAWGAHKECVLGQPRRARSRRAQEDTRQDSADAAVEAPTAKPATAANASAGARRRSAANASTSGRRRRTPKVPRARPPPADRSHAVPHHADHATPHQAAHAPDAKGHSADRTADAKSHLASVLHHGGARSSAQSSRESRRRSKNKYVAREYHDEIQQILPSVSAARAAQLDFAPWMAVLCAALFGVPVWFAVLLRRRSADVDANAASANAASVDENAAIF